MSAMATSTITPAAANRNRRDGPEGKGSGDKDDHRLLIAGLERRRRELREVAPLGDEDHGERGDERLAVSTLLLLDRPRLVGLVLAEVAANQERRHAEEENPCPDPNRFAGKQAQE